ncbi:MAG: hypothetical protein GYA39_07505 [Methanothrix sp.]|nr:hypothetical protein [Methanothrix sp.]
MNKATLILVAVGLLACAAAAHATSPGDFSGIMAIDKADMCSDDHILDPVFCTEVCSDTKGCEHYGRANRFMEQKCLECIVEERCDECGKTFYCDGICNSCGAPCVVYEYCPNCGAMYITNHADGICDKCGNGCYCIEKCSKCGHTHNYNGYCDECASRCHYLRCCYDLCEMFNHRLSEDCRGGAAEQLAIYEIQPVAQGKMMPYQGSTEEKSLDI